MNGLLRVEWWTDSRSSLQGRRRADFQLLDDSNKFTGSSNCATTRASGLPYGGRRIEKECGHMEAGEGRRFCCCRATLREDTFRIALKLPSQYTAAY